MFSRRITATAVEQSGRQAKVSGMTFSSVTGRRVVVTKF